MRYLTFEIRGQTWGVPVEMIALDRAKHYASEFDGDVQRSLREDTQPLFDEDDYQIEDWAVNNMNASDFGDRLVLLRDAPKLSERDFQDAWNSADKYVEEIDADRLPKAGS